MRTIIAGSRDITDYRVVCKSIALGVAELNIEITEVVCGMALGVDLLGKRWADECGIYVEEMPADWIRWGKKYAGAERNRRMAIYGEALIAVWDGQSTGTLNMIEQAKFRGLKIYVRNLSIEV